MIIQRIRGHIAVFFALLLGSGVAQSQDLPGPSANLQTIPKGSLVIAMDNAKQNLNGLPFNLKSYGLANRLLQNNIPLKWVIRAGKAKDGVDFTGRAKRVAPTALAEANLTFSGGPIIVHKAWASQALAHVASFGGNVAVYELTEDVVADVRHELQFKPLLWVNSTNGSIAKNYLDEAGISNYTVGSDALISSGACYTMVVEPHNTSTAGHAAIRAFVNSGGNFYAMCASVAPFENNATYGRYVTAGGVTGLTENNKNLAQNYPNPDLPFSQFIGDISPAPSGSESDWQFSSGATFNARGHSHAQASSGTPQVYSEMSGKVGTGLGGMVFYSGGHDPSASTIGDINLRRMFLNAVLTPANRPLACAFNVVIPDMTVAKTTSGTFRVGRTGSYTITATNSGTSNSVDTVMVTDTIPAGMTYSAASGTGWTFSVSGQVVTARYGGIITSGMSTSFTLTVNILAAAEGSVTNRAWVSGGGEVTTTNNLGSNTVTVANAGNADLSVAKSGPLSALPGDSLVYYLTVTNNGPDSAFFINLRDSLPANTTFLSASRTPTLAGRMLTWATFGPLAPGASRTDTVRARAPGTVATLTNISMVTSASTDPNPANNDGSAAASRVITQIVSSVTVTPDGLTSPILRLPGTGLDYQDFVVTNLSSSAGTFDLLSWRAGILTSQGIFLQVDSIRGTGLTAQTNPDSARVVLAGATAYTFRVWFTIPVGDTAVNIEYLRARLVGDTTIRDVGYAESRRVFPQVSLAKKVSPNTNTFSGTDLTYTLEFGNAGEYAAKSVTVTDKIPVETFFKVGSPGATLPAGLTAVPSYSLDGSAWTYSPVSTGCGAPAGFDACVRHVRWTLSGDMPAGTAAAAGSFTFIARIK